MEYKGIVKWVLITALVVGTSAVVSHILKLFNFTRTFRVITVGLMMMLFTLIMTKPMDYSSSRRYR